MHAKSLPMEWNSILATKLTWGAKLGTASVRDTVTSVSAFSGQWMLWSLHKSLSEKGNGRVVPPIIAWRVIVPLFMTVFGVNFKVPVYFLPGEILQSSAVEPSLQFRSKLENLPSTLPQSSVSSTSAVDFSTVIAHINRRRNFEAIFSNRDLNYFEQQQVSIVNKKVCYAHALPVTV